MTDVNIKIQNVYTPLWSSKFIYFVQMTMFCRNYNFWNHNSHHYHTAGKRGIRIFQEIKYILSKFYGTLLIFYVHYAAINTGLLYSVDSQLEANGILLCGCYAVGSSSRRGKHYTRSYIISSEDHRGIQFHVFTYVLLERYMFDVLIVLSFVNWEPVKIVHNYFEYLNICIPPNFRYGKCWFQTIA